MAVINEEFHRCACGGADFQVNETVMLLKNPKKRGLDQLSQYLPTFQTIISYTCIGCGKKLDK